MFLTTVYLPVFHFFFQVFEFSALHDIFVSGNKDICLLMLSNWSLPVVSLDEGREGRMLYQSLTIPKRKVLRQTGFFEHVAMCF